MKLLAVDIGNTNTVLGIFDGDTLSHHWRVATSIERTADENAILLRELFALSGAKLERGSAIISSVVPGATDPLRIALRQHFGVATAVVGTDIRATMPVLYNPPTDVGADRLVNAVAAYAKFRSGVIVVDFGTATTFDSISPRGEYLGGAIAPGIVISAEALYSHTAKLPRVALERPPSVVGRTTVESIQAGLVYGYASLVDGIIEKTMAEFDYPVRVIATGGLAPLISSVSKRIDEADELLTLRGLKLIHSAQVVSSAT